MASVEVIVPAYNEAGRIAQPVSALTDRYRVLVVDDGSTDDTAGAARDAGARVVEQPDNRGYIAATYPEAIDLPRPSIGPARRRRSGR